MIILKLILSVIGGLATHLLHKPTRRMGPRLGSLARYAIGELALIPFREAVSDSLPDAMTRRERGIVASLLAAGAFGAGVFIGFILDGHGEE